MFPRAQRRPRTQPLSVDLRDLLLAHAHKLVLLVERLEAAVAELGRRVDELERDLLGGVAARLLEERLAQRDDALLGADDGALDHDVVLLDQAIVRPAADRVDRLLGQIEVSGGVVLSATSDALAQLVNLLVHLRAVVVAVLASARHGILHLRRVPSANASHLAQTAVRLARQTRATPASDNAIVATALRDTDHIDHLILRED